MRRQGTRQGSTERRLFQWLLAMSLVPSLALLLAGAWLLVGSLGWAGALGPWEDLAASGRSLVEAADTAALDPALEAALARHRAELSESLVLARRWSYLGDRFASALPFLVLFLAAALAGLSSWAAARLARQLARPVRELVGWTERLARDEPLPEPEPREAREPRELGLLRGALRSASRELREARRRALEAERVRIWGELARRVAHEMKNPLMPLRLAAHRLRRAGTTDDEALDVVDEEIARLEELAAQFAALGRPAEGPTSEVDLGELLASLLETDVPPGVECALDVAPGVPRVEGRYDELLRAFRNLVRNAVEASPAGRGRVDVSVRGEDGRVEVVVADRGAGLPPDGAARIFEPDFTTKSRGTGLGLAIVRQAVEAHGGRVSAAAREGGGAEFSVVLPGRPAAPGAGRSEEGGATG